MLLSPRPEPAGAPARKGRRPIPPIPGLPPLCGLVCLDELPGILGLTLFQRAADVALWSECEPSQRLGLFRPGEPESAHDAPSSVMPALAALAHVVSQPEAARPAYVSQACTAISDWAQGAGHASTALLFAELAAVAEPNNPVAAVATGRALRDAARYARARRWFDRAERVAHLAADHQTRADAFLALGVLEERRGKLRQAMRMMRRTFRLAKRHGLADIGGHAHQNAVAICGQTHRFAEAQAHAEAAVTLYGPGHSHLPALAQDISRLWCEQGYFDAALPVLEAALAAMIDPDQRYIVTANLARAAAGVGDRDLFLRVWRELEQLDAPATWRFAADALVGLGEGAMMLGFAVAARDLAVKGLTVARDRGESVTAAEAEDLIFRLPQGQPVAPRKPPPDRELLLAARLVRMLTEAAAPR